jgi:hypothetical protein
MEFRYSYEYQLFYYYLVFNKKNKIINTHTHNNFNSKAQTNWLKVNYVYNHHSFLLLTNVRY